MANISLIKNPIQSKYLLELFTINEITNKKRANITVKEIQLDKSTRKIKTLKIMIYKFIRSLL